MKSAVLSRRMVALAETHDRRDELLAAADALDKASEGFFAEPQTIGIRQFIGVWARARRLWCDITGEPLV